VQDWPVSRCTYISGGERRLTRWLWTLLAITLVYSVFQHVILAGVPERFPRGAQLGDLFYDLTIAYIGAFGFYMLIVRLPQLRDRRNVYMYVEVLLWQLFEQARGLIMELDRMWRVDDHRERTAEETAMVMGKRPATLDSIRDVCSRIGPEQDVRNRERRLDEVDYAGRVVEQLHAAWRPTESASTDRRTPPRVGSGCAAGRHGSSAVRAGIGLFRREPARSTVWSGALADPLEAYLSAAWKLDRYRRKTFGDRTIAEMSAAAQADFRRLWGGDSLGSLSLVLRECRRTVGAVSGVCAAGCEAPSDVSAGGRWCRIWPSRSSVRRAR
jgi:hypothetical protein